jgi:hypothetical protein
MPAATKWNQHEREWLATAKADCMLEMSEKERADRYEQDVANIAAVLMGMANAKEVNENGG